MALGVLAVLMVMSIYSIAIMCERYLTFKSASRQSREFVPRVAEMLKTSQLDDALKLSQSYHKSHPRRRGQLRFARAGGGQQYESLAPDAKGQARAAPGLPR